jgi:hypothetical protein
MSVKLSEFVRSAISEICDGVLQSQTDISSLIGCDNYNNKRHPIRNAQNHKETMIAFEINTIVKDVDSLNGTIKSEIFVVSGNIDKNQSNEKQISSKISFSIPFDFSLLYNDN